MSERTSLEQPALRSQATERPRIESIDFVRGAVMVIMALDHARDYFHLGGWYSDPTDLTTTTGVLFFTRWITHFCAPVFVFLAGTSAFLYGRRGKRTAELSRFLWTRGLWLVVLQFVVVDFTWFFDPYYRIQNMQVIWAIGISMIVMAAVVRLPMPVILIFGALMVGGHNLLDSISPQPGNIPYVLWSIVHQRAFVSYLPKRLLMVNYPLVPWIGVMALGYCLGSLYRPGFGSDPRRTALRRVGMCCIGLFVLLRSGNFYGDAQSWSEQPTILFSVMSFLNTTKYPPSLLYLLMTIGPTLIVLGLIEPLHKRVVSIVVVFGRVPLLYYLLHIILLHLIALVMLLLQGGSWALTVITPATFIQGTLREYGVSLGWVYVLWLVAVVALYPPCKWYAEYKRRHRDRWWLSYL